MSHTISFLVSEDEAQAVRLCAYKRQMEVRPYLTWLARRFMLEMRPLPKPAPESKGRNIPLGCVVSRDAHQSLMQHVSKRGVDGPSLSDAMRALVYDDIRLLKFKV